MVTVAPIRFAQDLVQFLQLVAAAFVVIDRRTAAFKNQLAIAFRITFTPEFGAFLRKVELCVIVLRASASKLRQAVLELQENLRWNISRAGVGEGSIVHKSHICDAFFRRCKTPCTTGENCGGRCAGAWRA